MNKKIYALVFCGVAFFLNGDSFVVPKKKPAASTALKEECCQEMGGLFKLMPGTIKLSAELQEEILKNLMHLVEGNKKNILQGVEVEKVKQLIKKLQQLQKTMEEEQALLRDCLELIQEAQPATT